MNAQAALMETDSLGNVLWYKAYNTFSNLYNNFDERKGNELVKTYDENYVISYGGEYLSNLFKVDSVGNVLWSRALDLINKDIIETFDKELFIIGNGPKHYCKYPNIICKISD